MLDGPRNQDKVRPSPSSPPASDEYDEAVVERCCSVAPDSFEQYQGCIDNVTAEDVAGYDTPAAKAAIEAVQDPSENYPVP